MKKLKRKVGRKKRLPKKIILICFSKTRSGYSKTRKKFYVRVMNKTGKMMHFYQLFYELHQLEYEVNSPELRDSTIFRLSKKIGE